MIDNERSTLKEIDAQKGGDLSDKLLPCPFCGSPASDIKAAYDIWFIECENACCTQQDFDKNQCIVLWNTRAPSAQLTTTQQALDTAVQALKRELNTALEYQQRLDLLKDKKHQEFQQGYITGLRFIEAALANIKE